MIEAVINYSFMQRALLAALLASLLSGIIGTIIVQKKLVSMSGGIAHTSFGGIGLGYLLNIPPIFTGLLFAVIASLSLPVIKRKSHTGSDTIIGIFWATGMALGILFIGLKKGYPPDMTSYLFGDILTVSKTYLMLLLGLSAVILFIFIGMFNYWKVYLFDDINMRVLGINVRKFEIILYALIAFSIVLLIKVVGIILAIAVLTIPSATARFYKKNLGSIMIFSSIISFISSVVGLFISYYMNIPSGATIILTAAVIYILSYIVRK